MNKRMAKIAKPSRKRSLPSLQPFGNMKQSSILDHLQPMGKSQKRQTGDCPVATTSRAQLQIHSEGHAEENKPHIEETSEKISTLESSEPSYNVNSVQRTEEHIDIGPDWDQKADRLLQKHFGYSGLKSFQKEALGAWVAHQDCLVLAATGSGIEILVTICLLCVYFMYIIVIRVNVYEDYMFLQGNLCASKYLRF